MLIRLLCAHEMTNHVCNRFKFQAVAKKTAKNVRGYFILPHPVYVIGVIFLTLYTDVCKFCMSGGTISCWPRCKTEAVLTCDLITL